MDFATTHILSRPVITLTDGQAVIIDCRGMAAFNVLAGGGATITASRVKEQPTGTSFGLDGDVVPDHSSFEYTVAGDGTPVPVDYPFVRISTDGGDCDIGLV